MPHLEGCVAFRCKKCGHLHHAEHAGENEVPHACCVCGAGITLSPTVERIAQELADPTCTVEKRLALAKELDAASRTQGVKTWDPDNWECLCDATPERLAELGIEPAAVKAHAPAKITSPNFSSKPIFTRAKDGAVAKNAPVGQ